MTFVHRATAVVATCMLTQSACAWGQSDPHTVQPERPTVATHAWTVAPGYLEIESGVEVDHYNVSPSPMVASVLHLALSVPTVFKFGLTDHAQLSIFAPATKPFDVDRLGVGDLAAGVKWRLADEAPLLGRFAILPSIKLPTGSTSTGAGTGTTDLSLLLISSHDIGPVALDINAGYTRRGGDGSVTPRDATVWTISTGGPASGKLGWVAEVYGYPSTSGPAGQSSIVAALFGPTFAMHDWFAMDAGLIVPVNGPQPHAVYFGGVWNAGRIAGTSR